MTPRSGSVIAFAATTCLTSLMLLAQYQVNRQIYGNPGPSPVSVRYAPQYMGGVPGPTSSSQMMPSEVRHYYAASGATPTSVRAAYSSVGPMALAGPAAYMQQPGTYPRAAPTQGPAGNSVNRMVSGPSSMSPPSGPYSGGVAGAGSIRYGGAPASFGGQVGGGTVVPAAQPMTWSVPGALPAAGPLQTCNPYSQSIRYNK